MSRSAAAYQKFTEDEIRKANSVDILSLARGYGYEPEKAGRKAVHMKHSGGLYIFPENNRFFQWTGPDDGVKGGAIDFVMREENLSFPEAVGKLIGKEFSPSVKQVVPYEKKEREPLVLPEKADNMKRAYWYLVSVRGISPKIVSHFMNRKMIYQEKKYGNCVFVGYDAEGTALIQSDGSFTRLQEYYVHDNTLAECTESYLEQHFDQLEFDTALPSA